MMATATQVLRQEHDAILLVLEACEESARRLAAGKAVAPHLLEGMLEFFRLFADRCHHGKEEDLLFPMLERKGMPRQMGPIGVMLTEHDQGRAFIRQMAQAATDYKSGKAEATSRWMEAAHAYCGLLREHIAKENEVLFVMAERMLSAEEQQQLSAQFAAVEQERLGAGTHERLHELKNQIRKEMCMQGMTAR